MVVGAIPFDTRRPSSLYVPENCQFVANDSFTRAARPMLQQAHRPAACTSIPDEPRFKHAVAEAVSRFKQGKLDKAVLSRILDIELEQPVAGHQILNNLMVQNPTGYHFSLPLADGGVLIGASPELLIRKQGGEIHTNPLAGSARRQDDPQQDRLGSERLMRSTKDKYEHKLVIDDIRRHGAIVRQPERAQRPVVAQHRHHVAPVHPHSRRAAEPESQRDAAGLPAASDAGAVRLPDRERPPADRRSGTARSRPVQRHRRLVRRQRRR